MPSLRDLQTWCWRRKSMSWRGTLEAACSLYEKGMVSYPRTESGMLPLYMKGDFMEMMGKADAAGLVTEEGAALVEEGAFGEAGFEAEASREHHSITLISIDGWAGLSTEERAVMEGVATLNAMFPEWKARQEAKGVEGAMDGNEGKSKWPGGRL